MDTPLPTSIGPSAVNALNTANVNSLEDLSRLTEKEPAVIDGIDPEAVDTLKRCLDENQMCLLVPKGEVHKVTNR